GLGPDGAVHPVPHFSVHDLGHGEQRSAGDASRPHGPFRTRPDPCRDGNRDGPLDFVDSGIPVYLSGDARRNCGEVEGDRWPSPAPASLAASICESQMSTPASRPAVRIARRSTPFPPGASAWLLRWLLPANIPTVGR